MDRRDLDEIERFLTSVGRPTLFAYYGLEATVDAAAAEDAVKKRRTWAQGQQSNPKYKSEALFVIKNNALIRRVFVDGLESYRLHVRDDTHTRNLDVLTLFIKGTIAGGELTPQAEAAILHQGRQLELAEAAVTRRIEELLTETGARRVGFETDDLSTEALAVDHYALLAVSANATPAALEEAYRARYRWARNLKDLKRSSEVLNALDQAWRILSDPSKRARYDERRLQMLEMTDEVEKRSATLLGLLGGPEGGFGEHTFSPAAAARPAEGARGDKPAGPTTGSPPERSLYPEPIPPDDPSALRASRPHAVDRFREPVRAEPRPAPPPPRAPPLPPGGPPVHEARLPAGAAARPEASRAPSPPPVAGRTIGVATGPQAVATLGPRLAVEGPDMVAVQVGGRNVTRKWTVRNAGQGKMPGRVVCDREWLRVDPIRLDPSIEAQVVTVTVVPAQIPWGRTAGTVTVVTDHGERRTVTVQVHRRSWLPVVAGALAVGVLGVAALAALVYFNRDTGETALALSIDPVADRVVVDGQELGGGTAVAYAPPRADLPLQVRIEAEGFATHEELVSLRAGERTSRLVTLTLTDAMDWTPPEGVEPVEPPAAIRSAIEGTGALLARCFPADIAPPPEATYRTWVTPNGQVRRLEIVDATFADDTAAPCLRRVFRGLRLPTFTGEYTRVEARIPAKESR